jgi:hypothetical protein
MQAEAACSTKNAEIYRSIPTVPHPLSGFMSKNRTFNGKKIV